jgi:hypothetical protein
MSVIHDGINTDVVSPGGAGDEELITYVARNLEPYRGFPRLHARDPRDPEAPAERAHRHRRRRRGELFAAPCRPARPTASTCCAEIEGKADLSRVHFTGKIPYADYLALLRPLVSARLPDVPVRAVLVAARSDVGGLPGGWLAHAAGGGGDPRRRERAAHRLFLS